MYYKWRHHINTTCRDSRLYYIILYEWALLATTTDTTSIYTVLNTLQAKHASHHLNSNEFYLCYVAVGTLVNGIRYVNVLDSLFVLLSAIFKMNLMDFIAQSVRQFARIRNQKLYFHVNQVSRVQRLEARQVVSKKALDKSIAGEWVRGLRLMHFHTTFCSFNGYSRAFMERPA